MSVIKTIVKLLQIKFKKGFKNYFLDTLNFLEKSFNKNLTGVEKSFNKNLERILKTIF